MKILVTGGSGYIGSHTVVELIGKGYTPVVLDNLSNSRLEAVQAMEEITGKKIIFYQCDCSDRKSVEQIFNEHDIRATIHFAAFKAVGESVENPLKYYRNNIDSLLNLLAIYKDQKRDNFIFSSSCTVYGQPDSLPVTEHTPWKKPESPYGMTKQVGEQILSDAIRAFRFNGISLRYFNPAGAHISAKIGEYPVNAPGNLVPVITQTAMGLRSALTVFGDDYNTSDGTCVRDYIHVSDIATAHIAAVERLLEGRNQSAYEVFNLGSGRGHTVLEAIRAFETATGQKLNYRMGKRRPGDVEKVYADTSLAEKELRWKATRSLEEIMRSAWEWEKNLSKVGTV